LEGLHLGLCAHQLVDGLGPLLGHVDDGVDVLRREERGSHGLDLREREGLEPGGEVRLGRLDQVLGRDLGDHLYFGLAPLFGLQEHPAVPGFFESRELERTVHLLDVAEEADASVRVEGEVLLFFNSPAHLEAVVADEEDVGVRVDVPELRAALALLLPLAAVDLHEQAARNRFFSFVHEHAPRIASLNSITKSKLRD